MPGTIAKETGGTRQAVVEKTRREKRTDQEKKVVEDRGSEDKTVGEEEEGRAGDERNRPRRIDNQEPRKEHP